MILFIFLEFFLKMYSMIKIVYIGKILWIIKVLMIKLFFVILMLCGLVVGYRLKFKFDLFEFGNVNMFGVCNGFVFLK